MTGRYWRAVLSWLKKQSWNRWSLVSEKKGDNQLVCYSCVVHHVAMFHFWYRNLFIYSWNQVGIVYEGMKFPLWLDGHNIVKFVVVSSCPEKSVGILLLLCLLTSTFSLTSIHFIICISFSTLLTYFSVKKWCFLYSMLILCEVILE